MPDVHDDRAVVLHSSWWGRVTAVLTPVLLIGGGAWGMSVRPNVLAGLFLFGGLFLLGASLWDHPLRAEIGPRGITRRCLFRSEHLVWDEVSCLARPPRSLMRVATRRANAAGLAAERGKRRYLLADVAESVAEHDEIARRVQRWAPGLPIRASRPADTNAPTWLRHQRAGSGDGLVDLVDDDAL